MEAARGAFGYLPSSRAADRIHPHSVRCTHQRRRGGQGWRESYVPPRLQIVHVHPRLRNWGHSMSMFCERRVYM